MTAQHLCGFYAVRSQDGIYIFCIGTFQSISKREQHTLRPTNNYTRRTMDFFYSRLCEREHNRQSHTNAGENK